MLTLSQRFKAMRRFATTFSLANSTTLEDIRRFMMLAAQAVRAELYKLHIYRLGDFFKPHVDTPRGAGQFGSLVVRACSPSLSPSCTAFCTQSISQRECHLLAKSVHLSLLAQPLRDITIIMLYVPVALQLAVCPVRLLLVCILSVCCIWQVSLPCEHEGGELLVRFKGRERRFSLKPTSKLAEQAQEVHWAAFYADCEHEV